MRLGLGVGEVSSLLRVITDIAGQDLRGFYEPLFHHRSQLPGAFEYPENICIPKAGSVRQPYQVEEGQTRMDKRYLTSWPRRQGCVNSAEAKHLISNAPCPSSYVRSAGLCPHQPMLQGHRGRRRRIKDRSRPRLCVGNLYLLKSRSPCQYWCLGKGLTVRVWDLE